MTRYEQQDGFRIGTKCSWNYYLSVLCSSPIPTAKTRFGEVVEIKYFRGEKVYFLEGESGGYIVREEHLTKVK